MEKTRVFITTDVGGSDPDDIQSLMHILFYTDCLEIVGISCSVPRGDPKVAHKVLDAYRRDYRKFKLMDRGLQSPESLKQVVYQGSKVANQSTQSPGSRALVRASEKGPLLILVWGSATDLAVALRHGLDTVNAEAHIIASWNSEQDPKSAKFVKNSHLKKWINNSTFRGMYLAAPKEGLLGVRGVVVRVIQHCGALGKLVHGYSKNINIGEYCFKAGDTGSTLWAIDRARQHKINWAGKFERVDARTFSDSKAKDDQLSVFPGSATLARRRRFWLGDYVDRLGNAYDLGEKKRIRDR